MHRLFLKKKNKIIEYSSNHMIDLKSKNSKREKNFKILNKFLIMKKLTKMLIVWTGLQRRS